MTNRQPMLYRPSSPFDEEDGSQNTGYQQKTSFKEDSRIKELRKWKIKVETGIKKITSDLNLVDRKITNYGMDIFGNLSVKEPIKEELFRVRDELDHLVEDFRAYPKPMNQLMKDFIQNTYKQYDLTVKELVGRINGSLGRLEASQETRHDTKIVINPFDDDNYYDDLRRQTRLTTRSPSVSDESIESQYGKSYQRQSKMQTYSTEINSELMEIEDKDKEIRRLYESIKEINTIFGDLATMIDEQQFDLDTIESNINDANENVIVATKEIKWAQVLERKANKKYCICLLILLVIFAIIFAALWVEFHPKGGSNGSSGGGAGGGNFTEIQP